MIFECNHCGKEIPELRTDGDEINHEFICPACTKDLREFFRRANEIQHLLQAHIDKVY